MLKPLAFAAASLGLLAACDAPTPGMTMSPEAAAMGSDITMDNIAPAVSANTALSTFDTFCGRFAGNPAGTRAAVQSAGYVLLASMTSDGLEMWTSNDGRPLVATGRRDGAEVCMVMMSQGASLDNAVASYVQRKHGGAAMDMGSMQVGLDRAENVWVVPTTPPVIYFTLVQNQPGIGEIEALAVVTE